MARSVGPNLGVAVGVRSMVSGRAPNRSFELLVCGFLRLASTTGAGGEKRLSSYAGIWLLSNLLLDKIQSLFSPRQPWASDAKLWSLFNARNDDVYPRMLGEVYCLRNLHLAILDRGFVRCDLHVPALQTEAYHVYGWEACLRGCLEIWHQRLQWRPGLKSWATDGGPLRDRGFVLPWSRRDYRR
jgi:hypothetical protein